MSQATVITGRVATSHLHLLQVISGMALQINTGLTFSKGNLFAFAGQIGYCTPRARYTQAQKVAALREVIAKVQESDPTYTPKGSVLRALEG